MTPRIASLRTEDGRARFRWVISRWVSRATYRYGFVLLSDYFYQPLPARKDMLDHRQPCRAVEASLDEQATFARDLLTQYADELRSELASFGYSADSGQIQAMDASMLYAMIRHSKPQRLVEVGSGASTKVIAAALDRNARADGQTCTFTSIDPFVVPAIEGDLDGRVTFEHRMEPLQSIDAEIWTALGPRDILFIDSSHVFKAGSDVEHQFTRIYPSLASGVLVHLHDIFLPNDYPLEWNLERFQFWNEQQYLAVMLDNSDRYEVVAGLAALFESDPAFFAGLVDNYDEANSPGSIWLRRRASAL